MMSRVLPRRRTSGKKSLSLDKVHQSITQLVVEKLSANAKLYFILSCELIRSYDKPHWHDILPLKLSIWLYLSIKSLPQVIQELKQYYQDYQEMKLKEKEEAEALAAQEAQQSERANSPLLTF